MILSCTNKYECFTSKSCLTPVDSTWVTRPLQNTHNLIEASLCQIGNWLFTIKLFYPGSWGQGALLRSIKDFRRALEIQNSERHFGASLQLIILIETCVVVHKHKNDEEEYILVHWIVLRLNLLHIHVYKMETQVQINGIKRLMIRLIYLMVREHPFNLKGLWFFWGKF